MSLSPSQARRDCAANSVPICSACIWFAPMLQDKRWIVAGARARARMGDLVLQMGPGQEPAHWVVTD